MAAAVYRFGPFSVDLGTYRLWRDGETVALTPQLLDLLVWFTSHAGSLCTKEQLFAAVWPDTVVTDNALTQAESELRAALGDRAAAPRYIQTVPRRGYRFVAEVTVVAPD